jgi:cellulose synthase/poly-beta-1,6-N-acetylglucosamine synthase-like glycosyltransferase
VIVPAYNEEEVILAKLDNILGQDYPLEKIEILVASDGSDDGTHQLVEKYAQRHPQVKLLALPRQGKAFALNAAADAAKNDVLVLTDANAMLENDTLRYLTAPFADQAVGGVAGNQAYNQDSQTGGAGRGEILYWSYDTWLKQKETMIGSAISADGALYALRRHLYVPIKDPAGTDDFQVSTRVVVGGYRLVFEPNALVSEDTTGSDQREFRRKARIINRGLRSLFGLGSFLWPWNGGLYAVQMISHKLLRRVVPLVLPFLLISNALIINRGWFNMLVFIGQVLLYLFGLLGFLLRKTRLAKFPVVYVPYYFLQINTASLLGIIWLLRGESISIWQPQRTAG